MVLQKQWTVEIAVVVIKQLEEMSLIELCETISFYVKIYLNDTHLGEWIYMSHDLWVILDPSLL